MIEVENLTKHYGSKVAVDNISFQVRPGRVTGFLGPNGAGKSTTMRMIVGLDRPTRGRALVDGSPYVTKPAPLHAVGALLEAKAVHTGRSARNHLRALAATNGIPNKRVDEVIEMTGLKAVANKRVGGFSLGMGQRLGIAVALLGDPSTIILDEPVNGLDPEGVKWVRTMIRYLADQGRTVFLSSHLMSEMAITADDLIVIGRGKIITTGPVQDVIDATTKSSVLVRSPQAVALAELLARQGVSLSTGDETTLTVRGIEAFQVGDIAASAGIPLHELTPQRASLEEAYMTLTADDVEFASHSLTSSQNGAAA